ncbi:hypothetical protein VTO42DRAFT_467 [Malbranchea cinnamomea]
MSGYQSSYLSPDRSNTSSPLSAPHTGQTLSFKTNVNRNKTKRWVNAKKYSYDGEDWGSSENDEAEEQTLAPQPPSLRNPLSRTASPDAVQQTKTESEKPLPFVRPADIYKRMAEEKERERQQQPTEPVLNSSSRLSQSTQDAARGTPPALRPGAEARHLSQPDHSAAVTTSTSPVYLHSVSGEEDVSTPRHAASQQSHQLHVPELGSISSGFGLDVVGDGPLQTDTITKSTTPEEGTEVSASETGLYRETSLGFRSVVQQAFDAETPDSLVRTDTSSTISPIIKSGTMPTSQNKRSAVDTTPTIEEEPSEKRDSVPPGFQPGYRRSMTPPSSKDSPAQKPVLSANLRRVKSDIALVADQTPAEEKPEPLSTPHRDISPKSEPAVSVNEHEQAGAQFGKSDSLSKEGNSGDITVDVRTQSPPIERSTPPGITPEPLAVPVLNMTPRLGQAGLTMNTEGVIPSVNLEQDSPTVSYTASPHSVNDRLEDEIIRSLTPSGSPGPSAYQTPERLGNETPALAQKLESPSPSHQSAHPSQPQLRRKFSWEADSDEGTTESQPQPTQTECEPLKPVESLLEEQSAASQTQAPLTASSVYPQPPLNLSEKTLPDVQHEMNNTSGDSQPSMPNISAVEPVAPRDIDPIHAEPIESLKEPETTTTDAVSQYRPTTQELKFTGFREIMAIKDYGKRIEALVSTRDKFAGADTGLQNWIQQMALSAEHAELIALNGKLPADTNISHKTLPSRSKFSRLSSLGGISLPHHDSSSPSSHRRHGSINLGRVINGQHVQTKGKDLLHSAGVLSGKAGDAAKGLLAKGRSKFRHSGTGDKVAPQSPSSTSLDEKAADTIDGSEHETTSKHSSLSLAEPLKNDSPEYRAQSQLATVRSMPSDNEGVASHEDTHDAAGSIVETKPKSDPVQTTNDVVNPSSPTIVPKIELQVTTTTSDAEEGGKASTGLLSPEAAQCVSPISTLGVDLDQANRTDAVSQDSDIPARTVSISTTGLSRKPTTIDARPTHPDAMRVERSSPVSQAHAAESAPENPHTSPEQSQRYSRRFSFEEDDTEKRLTVASFKGSKGEGNRKPKASNSAETVAPGGTDEEQRRDDSFISSFEKLVDFGEFSLGSIRLPSSARPRLRTATDNPSKNEKPLPPPPPQVLNGTEYANLTTQSVTQRPTLVDVRSQISLQEPWTYPNAPANPSSSVPSSPVVQSPTGRPAIPTATNSHPLTFGPAWNKRNPSNRSSVASLPPASPSSSLQNQSTTQHSPKPAAYRVSSQSPLQPSPQTVSGSTFAGLVSRLQRGHHSPSSSIGSLGSRFQAFKADMQKPQHPQNQDADKRAVTTPIDWGASPGSRAASFSTGESKKTIVHKFLKRSTNIAEHGSGRKSTFRKLNSLLGKSTEEPVERPSQNQNQHEQLPPAAGHPPPVPQHQRLPTIVTHPPPVPQHQRFSPAAGHPPPVPQHQQIQSPRPVRPWGYQSRDAGDVISGFPPAFAGGSTPTPSSSTRSNSTYSPFPPLQDQRGQPATSPRSHAIDLHLRSRSPLQHPPDRQEGQMSTQNTSDPASTLGTFYTSSPKVDRVGDQEKPWTLSLPKGDSDGQGSSQDRIREESGPPSTTSLISASQYPLPESGVASPVNLKAADMPPPPLPGSPFGATPVPAPAAPGAASHVPPALSTPPVGGNIAPTTSAQPTQEQYTPAEQQRQHVREIVTEPVELPATSDDSSEEIVMSSTAYPGQEWRPAYIDNWD